jgi:hypothetical protein
LPAGDSVHASELRFPERPEPRKEDVPLALYESVTDDYFRTMQVPLFEGRFFDRSDRQTARRVAIIDEWTARHHWAKQNPLGRQFRLGSREPLLEVVGVVGNVEQGVVVKILKGQIGQVYLPFSQAPKPTISLVVRSRVIRLR